MEPSISTSTDVAVIEKLFPSLEGAETIEMEQLKYGGSDRPEVLPAPVDYNYRGYITLSEAAAEKYASAYSFTEMQPQVSFASVKEREGQWTYSFDFSKEIIPAGYSGYIWMDGTTLLFDIGTM